MWASLARGVHPSFHVLPYDPFVPTPSEPRPRQQRRLDTVGRLENDVDAWVASVDPDGRPRLAPLSFLWDGEFVIMSTSVTTPAGRNMIAADQVRLGIGDTRDVVHIEGTVVAARPGHEVASETADAFAAKTGFDPRDLPAYRYFVIKPERIRAWREENELRGSVLMQDGTWLTS
jgi:hypothetical protein